LYFRTPGSRHRRDQSLARLLPDFAHPEWFEITQQDAERGRAEGRGDHDHVSAAELHDAQSSTRVRSRRTTCPCTKLAELAIGPDVHRATALAEALDSTLWACSTSRAAEDVVREHAAHDLPAP
jgi:hypothetical protein